MARERSLLCRFRIWCMNLPIEAPSDALPKSMLQEVQTIHRWDGLEPVAGATGDWSGGKAVELGEESGGGERRKGGAEGRR